MKKDKQPPTTILVGSIPLNKGNEIRVVLGPFAGRMAINIRHWYTDEAGELKPTKKGIFG